MTTPATLTTEELDALDKFCDVLMDLHNPDPVRKHAGDTILAAAPRLIEQARLHLACPWVEADARGERLRVAAHELQVKLESAESSRDSLRERLEKLQPIVDAVKADLLTSIHVECERLETCKYSAPGCSKNLPKYHELISAIAAKACTGGKGEGEK